LEPAKPPTRACRLGGGNDPACNLTTSSGVTVRSREPDALRPDGRDWHVDQVERQNSGLDVIWPGRIPVTLPGSRPHVICGRHGRKSINQQLGRSGGDEENAARSVPGQHEGRTLSLIPFAMGPLKLTVVQVGIEISDSPYVVINMRIMTRVGSRCSTSGSGRGVHSRLHSVVAPLNPGQKMSPGRASRTRKEIHRSFSLRSLNLSYGSGLWRQCIAGKKCLAFASPRSWRGKRAGSRNTCSSLPHFAAGQKTLPRSGVSQRLRQDQPRHDAPHFWPAGRRLVWAMISPGFASERMDVLYAMNPETGFFGVAPARPGNRIECGGHLCGDSIFTSCA